MSSNEWPAELVEKLNSGEGDSEIVQFIEETVPEDEARIFDNKREVYVSSSDDKEGDKRRAKLAKSIAGLSNVFHRSKYRFLFIGFNDTSNFVGVQHLGANGGEHVLDADDQKIQNILRDHLEPPPNVEKYRIDNGTNQGVILVIERIQTPPTVLTKTVSAEGDRITTQGIVPTRRGSETTHMRHADLRNIVEHREGVLQSVLQDWVDDIGRVIGAPVNEIEQYEYAITNDPDAPAVRNVVVPQEARSLNQDLNAKTMGWLTDNDLPGSEEVLYKFYCKRDMIENSGEEHQNNKMGFLFNSSVAHYLPGAEWLSRYNGDWEALFSKVLELDYNHWSILMLERILLILGWDSLLRDIKSDSRFEYSDSKANQYASLCSHGTIERIEEYVGSSIRFDGNSYSVSDLYSDEDQLNSLFAAVCDQCHNGEPVKGTLREIELVRLANIGSGRMYLG